jgi:hypothetical protein
LNLKLPSREFIIWKERGGRGERETEIEGKDRDIDERNRKMER